ncbi:hypothetical protein DM02DRAFT_164480 [Periconia macrospinosa]|uniref:Uncharacterized protein n=1 Tax=Periconia macrospinosa TaxID=97972 RepID=A0A2V1DCH0_9PLEO|nr:hypothetical protein DM02DRAFT_164480 [Periconia macrospinosa]
MAWPRWLGTCSRLDVLSRRVKRRRTHNAIKLVLGFVGSPWAGTMDMCWPLLGARNTHDTLNARLSMCALLRASSLHEENQCHYHGLESTGPMAATFGGYWTRASWGAVELSIHRVAHAMSHPG